MKHLRIGFIFSAIFLLPLASCKKDNLYSLMKIYGAPNGYIFISTLGVPAFYGYADELLFFSDNTTRSFLGNLEYKGTYSKDGNELSFTAEAVLNGGFQLCTYYGTMESQKNNPDDFLGEPNSTYLISGYYDDNAGNYQGPFIFYSN